MQQSYDELRKQVIKEIREQRERRRIYGSIPEWVIDIKMRQRQQETDTLKK